MNRMGSYVTSRHLTNGHVIEENRHQNNVKAYINKKMFQRSLKLSNRTFKFDVKILDLLRRFKAGKDFDPWPNPW